MTSPFWRKINSFGPLKKCIVKINNETKQTFEENPLENLIEKKLANQIPIIEQENNNLNHEFKDLNKETNNRIPKVETKYPAKVKKLMLLYEDGFFEEYNYR